LFKSEMFFIEELYAPQNHRILIDRVNKVWVASMLEMLRATI
jgi:hypothetical protein